MIGAIMEAGDDQLTILNKAFERWPQPHYGIAAKAATQRAGVLELRNPSTVANPLADPATGKLGLNATPWRITDPVKHFAECGFHFTRMTQKKGINKNNKPYCRYDCSTPGCDVGAWHSDIFND